MRPPTPPYLTKSGGWKIEGKIQGSMRKFRSKMKICKRLRLMFFLLTLLTFPKHSPYILPFFLLTRFPFSRSCPILVPLPSLPHCLFLVENSLVHVQHYRLCVSAGERRPLNVRVRIKIREVSCVHPKVSGIECGGANLCGVSHGVE